jgi:hypothetical protein
MKSNLKTQKKTQPNFSENQKNRPPNSQGEIFHSSKGQKG